MKSNRLNVKCVCVYNHLPPQNSRTIPSATIPAGGGELAAGTAEAGARLHLIVLGSTQDVGSCICILVYTLPNCQIFRKCGQMLAQVFVHCHRFFKVIQYEFSGFFFIYEIIYLVAELSEFNKMFANFAEISREKLSLTPIFSTF